MKKKADRQPVNIVKQYLDTPFATPLVAALSADSTKRVCMLLDQLAPVIRLPDRPKTLPGFMRKDIEAAHKASASTAKHATAPPSTHDTVHETDVTLPHQVPESGVKTVNVQRLQQRCVVAVGINEVARAIERRQLSLVIYDWCVSSCLYPFTLCADCP